jgi:hypothetical protein
MVARRLLSAVALLLALPSCPAPAPVEPSHVTVRTDGIECCKDMCSSLRELGCPEGQDTRSGETCEDLCKRVYMIGFEVGACCVASATTKEEARSCRTRRGWQATRCGR